MCHAVYLIYVKKYNRVFICDGLNNSILGVLLLNLIANIFSCEIICLPCIKGVYLNGKK